MTIAAIMAFGLFLSGGYGLIALVDRIFKTRLNEKVLSDPNNQRGCLVVIVVGFLNAIIVGTGGGYLLDALGWGAWLTDVTNWGRANGAGEDGLFLVSAIFCQWPWIIWLMLAKVGRTASD